VFQIGVYKKYKMPTILGKKHNFSIVSELGYCNIGEVQIYG